MASNSFPTPYVPGLDIKANRGPQMNAVGACFIVITFSVLVLRLISRLYTHIRIWLDDWLILAAAIFCWAYTVGVIVLVQYDYYGQHISKSNPRLVEEFFKGLYGIAIIYPIALTLSKLSLLALYWRIFRITSARRPLQVVAALNIGWMIAAFFVGIFSCTPVYGFWILTAPSTCINYNVFFTANESFTIALDLVVILMPIYFIAQIQRSLSQRIAISSTFVLGLLVTIISGLRLWRLSIAQQQPGFDPTWNEVDAALWAILELNIWIIVASIPSLRPMIGKIVREKYHETDHDHVSARLETTGSKMSSTKGLRTFWVGTPAATPRNTEMGRNGYWQGTQHGGGSNQFDGATLRSEDGITALPQIYGKDAPPLGRRGGVRSEKELDLREPEALDRHHSNRVMRVEKEVVVSNPQQALDMI